MNNTISRIDRKRILLFVAICYSVSIAVAAVILVNGGLYTNYPFEQSKVGNLLAVNMFAPAVAVVAIRLITREGWSNTFLRPNLRRGWRFYLAAWLLPFMAIIVGGGIYYLMFPGRFDPSMQWAREVGLVKSATDPWTVFWRQTILDSLLWTPMTIFLMLGEEFGWRAYLLPKLMPLGPRKAVVLMGAIWAGFHWPAILLLGFEYGFGYWGAPVVGLLLFLLITIAASPVFSWVTLRTGSVWPACIAHLANNSLWPLMAVFLMGEWDPLIGPATSGLVGTLGYALLALLIFSSPHALAQPAPAPVGVASSKNAGVVEKAADQAKLGTVR